MNLASPGFMRVLELLSVFPAYLHGEVMKQIYLQGISRKVELNSMAAGFMNSTAAFVESKLTPGGFYTGVWCRDASYIINELSNMEKHSLVAQKLEWIWRHQIRENADVKFVHGRGTPEMNYSMQYLRGDSSTINFLKSANGALPTSIQNGYCEVYGQNPDIDSTGLMVSVTCKCCLQDEQLSNRLIPRIRNAVSYLESRDLDGDLLLEQGPNEDWMDRMLRSGKLVYNQGIWITTLLRWARLLRRSGFANEADDADQKAALVANSVENILWNSQKECYLDQSESQQQTRITQDMCFFLLAMKEGNYSKERVEKSLSTVEKVLWKQYGASCQEPPSRVTAPPILAPYKYQNGGVWPWITSAEILARLSYSQVQEPKLLLQRILPVAHLEWIDPNNMRNGGAFPFRTGIAAIRTALRKFLEIYNKT